MYLLLAVRKCLSKMLSTISRWFLSAVGACVMVSAELFNKQLLTSFQSHFFPALPQHMRLEMEIITWM